VLLEANYFDGVDSPHEFNGDDEATAYITVGEGELINVYNDTSGSELAEGKGTPFTDPPYDFEADPAEDVPEQVKAGAGPH
jgi:pectate lyase